MNSAAVWISLRPFSSQRSLQSRLMRLLVWERRDTRLLMRTHSTGVMTMETLALEHLDLSSSNMSRKSSAWSSKGSPGGLPGEGLAEEVERVARSGEACI